ncbi:LOW QUALITY PROTEIN: hypothetical protein RJ640_002778 [Escallonia rubra]|uniref:J domain-containing protein n=1 Tax=Escallonia rubra TaxID=112253 RepID=A0AA88RD84_9ASTE|nr:LOW QUALITY PROTEIN: hypothetical protein RJ640_002778 [Escallonia rubra]
MDEVMPNIDMLSSPMVDRIIHRFLRPPHSERISDKKAEKNGAKHEQSLSRTAAWDRREAVTKQGSKRLEGLRRSGARDRAAAGRLGPDPGGGRRPPRRREADQRNHLDWYGILQLDRRTDDLEIVKKQYRRLALLLHPDKNKFPFTDAAFKLVADSWAVLSNQTRKSSYDVEVNMFTKVDPVAMKKQKDLQNQQHDLFQQKFPVTRSSFAPPPPQQQPAAAAAATDGGGGGGARPPKFWPACPYCYNLTLGPRVYEDCCLRCQNCQRAFHASVIPSLPPLVSGKDAYYCCWGFFPMGFAAENSEAAKNAGFQNWIPPMFPSAGTKTKTAAAPVVPPVVEEVTPPPGMEAPNGGVAGAAVEAAPESRL